MTKEEYTEYKELSNDLLSKLDIKSLKHCYYYPVKLVAKLAIKMF